MPNALSSGSSLMRSKYESFSLCTAKRVLAFNALFLWDGSLFTPRSAYRRLQVTINIYKFACWWCAARGGNSGAVSARDDNRGNGVTSLETPVLHHKI